MLNIFSDAQPGSSRGRSGGGFFSFVPFRCQPFGNQKQKEGESLFRTAEAKAKLSAAEGADPVPRSFHLPQCKFDQGGKRYSLQGDAPALSQRLKQLDVNPNAPDDYGRSLLHLAVLAGNAEAVSFLVAALRVEVNALDSLERTPLHWISSISKPNMEIAQCLLKNGADVNAQDIFGNTPLHHATSAGGHLPLISELLHEGADPSALNYSGLSPLAVAIGPNLVRLEALLGPSTALPTPEPQHMDRSRSPSPSRPPRAGRGRSQTPKKSAHQPRTQSKLGSSVGRLIAFVLGGPDAWAASPDRSVGQAEEEHQDGAASFDTANQQAARGLDLGQLAVALKEHAPQPGRLELPLPATPQLVDGTVSPGHRRNYRPHRWNDSQCSYKGQSAPPSQNSAALSRKTDQPRTSSSSSLESLEMQGLDVSSVPAAPSAGDKKQLRPSKDSTLTGLISCQSNASPTGSRRSSSCSPVETNKLEWADRMITLLLDRPKANSASLESESESEAVVAPRPRTGHSPWAGSPPKFPASPRFPARPSKAPGHKPGMKSEAVLAPRPRTGHRPRAGPSPKFPASPPKAPGQKPGMKPLGSPPLPPPRRRRRRPALVKKSQSAPPPCTVPEAPAFNEEDQTVPKSSKERPPLPACPPPHASREAQSTPPKKRGGPPPASPPPPAGVQPPATPPQKQMRPPATPLVRPAIPPLRRPPASPPPRTGNQLPVTPPRKQMRPPVTPDLRPAAPSLRRPPASPPPRTGNQPPATPPREQMRPPATPALSPATPPLRRPPASPPPRTGNQPPATPTRKQMRPPATPPKRPASPPLRRPPASPPPRTGNQPPATPPQKQMRPPATPPKRPASSPLRRLVTPMQSPLSASKLKRQTTSPGGGPLSPSYERALRRAPSSDARAFLFPEAELAEARGGFSGDGSEGSNHLPKPPGDLSRGSSSAAERPRAKSAAPAVPQPFGMHGPSSSARPSLFPKAELAEARGGFSGDGSEGSNHLPKPPVDLSRRSSSAAGMPRSKSAALAVPQPSGMRGPSSGARASLFPAVPQPSGMLCPRRKDAGILALRQAHPRGAASLPPGARLSNAARAVRSGYGPELSLVDVPYALPPRLHLDLTLRPGAPGGAGVDPGKARAPGGKEQPALLVESPAARQMPLLPARGAVMVGYAAGTGSMAMPGPRWAEGRAPQASDFAPFMERGRGRAEGGGACTCRPGGPGPPCAHGAEGGGGGKAAKWDVAARIRTEEDRLAVLRAERLAKLRARELATAGQQGSDGTASVSSEEEEEGEEA